MVEQGEVGNCARIHHPVAINCLWGIPELQKDHEEQKGVFVSGGKMTDEVGYIMCYYLLTVFAVLMAVCSIIVVVV